MLKWVQVGLMFLALSVLVQVDGFAKFFEVNIKTDAPDADITDGVCDIDLDLPDEQCSLRAAIEESNLTLEEEDTILLEAVLYTLSEQGRGEDVNKTGDLDILSPIIIEGEGTGLSILDGAGAESLQNDRLFHIHEGGSLTLIGMTIRYGHIRKATFDDEAHASGGAIWNLGTAHLSDMEFMDNIATFGGAIANEGVMTLENISFTNNTSKWRDDPDSEEDDDDNTGGGAIANSGELTITNVNFFQNSAEGLNAFGGAIFNATKMNIEASEFHENQAEGFGAAIANIGTDSVDLNQVVIYRNVTETGNGGGIYNTGSLMVRNSAINFNQAGLGGGILNEAGDITLSNVTLHENVAVRGGGFFNTGVARAILTYVTITANTSPGNPGAGLLNGLLEDDGSTFNPATVNIRYSLLAQNISGPSEANPEQEGPSNCAGTGITSNGYNLSNDASCVDIFNAPTDINETDPLLGPITPLGEVLPTRPLLEDSPAIDAIPLSSCLLAQDARDISRPQGEGCDIGAYEWEVETEPEPDPDPDPDPGTVTIEEALDANNNGIIDDAEIKEAIVLWALSDPVPGTDGLIIDDQKILQLVEMWALSTPIEAGEP